MSEPKSKNITFHGANVTAEERETIRGQKGCVVWTTGLSGSGKSTVARRAEQLLLEAGHQAYVLDGDNVRFGLNKELGFSPDDRTENIRRIGEVCRLFQDAGLVVLTAFISPYRSDRNAVRALHPAGSFLEVHVDTPIEVCEERDVKGLYAKARAGEIPDFSGISAPYEAPVDPDLRIDTSQPLADCVEMVLDALDTEGFDG